jgi:secreted Zn-dependent insulinase-like peptidase
VFCSASPSIPYRFALFFSERLLNPPCNCVSQAPEDTLTGDSLLPAWDPALVATFLACMTVDNLIVIATNRACEAQVTQTEKWLGAQYHVEPLPDTWRQRLGAASDMAGGADVAKTDSAIATAVAATTAAVNLPLALPRRNPYIPTDFTLVPLPVPAAPEAATVSTTVHARKDGHAQPVDKVPAEGAAATDSAAALMSTRPALAGAPTQVWSTPHAVGWYAPDLRFRKPRARLYVNAWSPVLGVDAFHQVVTTLLIHILDDALDDVTYEAGLAGLSASWGTSGSDTLQLTVNGFSEKLPLLARQMVDRFWSTPIRPERLALLKERLARAYRNRAMQQPYEHAGTHRSFIFGHRVHATADYLAAVADVTVADIESLRLRCFKHAHVDTMVYGNLTPAAAAELMQDVTLSLRRPALIDALDGRDVTPRGLLPSHWLALRSRAVWLPVNPAGLYVHQFRHENPGEKNHAVSMWFDVGSSIASVERRMAVALLARVYKAPCFAQLRTQEQLGYLVWSGWSVQSDVMGFFMTVQSDHADPTTLTERMLNMMAGFRDRLLATPVAELETHRASLVQELLEEPKTPHEEASELWTEIDLRRWQWTRATEAAVAARALVLPDALVAVMDERLVPGAPERRALALHVFAPRVAVLPPVVAPDVAVTDVVAFKHTLPLQPCRPLVAAAPVPL